ncbi:MAG: glucose-6-phosphate dehydrogenase [Hyphomicrobiales bacterium]|nr:glucose-6-phosphate dehydrogenase [Hyphomicrobiales bacterium]
MTLSSIRKAPPCAFVLFGANGDLTHRLVFPALYNLAVQKLLPEGFAIIAVTRSEFGEREMRDHLRDGLKQFCKPPVDEKVANALLERVQTVVADASDPASFETLKKTLADADEKHDTHGNRIFYLAIPPKGFAPTVQALGKAGLTGENNGSYVRVIIEKPFGSDLASATKLNSELRAILKEDQIFRIDHYLGKETVQNILMLRFANGLFEPIWKREHIDHVQITVAESVTVGRRGAFYDETGALRDMVPNHLFQLLSLVAMEPPARLDAQSVRSEKARALDAIRQWTPEEALANSVRAQYVAGKIGDEQIADYRSEKDVAPNSTTETFVALRLAIDNWRWAGVPFYMRTGKALARRYTEVAIKFREAPISMFRGIDLDGLRSNYLVLQIAPDEGITLQFNAKTPGPNLAITRVAMDFKYSDFFDTPPATGYETLLFDCMIGDGMLYQRDDGVEAGWRAVEPFLRAWRQAGESGLALYRAGSTGPAEADALLARDHRRWRPTA